MVDLNFNPFPILFTERLTLRQLNLQDELAIFNLRTNDTINKYIDRPKPTTIKEATDFIIKINDAISKNQSLYWAITLKENSELIGTICLYNFVLAENTAELGYELFPAYQGKGIMDEALKAVINYALTTLQLKSIDAFTHQENIASIKLLVKNNFFYNKNKIDDYDRNVHVYSLIKTI